ncbi:unnamed protein product, partial [Iphiclides podalirius]
MVLTPPAWRTLHMLLRWRTQPVPHLWHMDTTLRPSLMPPLQHLWPTTLTPHLCLTVPSLHLLPTALSRTVPMELMEPIDMPPVTTIKLFMNETDQFVQLYYYYLLRK